MELGKVIASIFVVFNHFNFPDAGLQGVLDCLCGFCVPMFLAISGYFNYGARPDQIRRRLLHILKLYIAAYAVQILWNVIITELNGGSTVVALKNTLPDAEGLFLWLTLQKDPFLGHLWYLASISLCYLVLWGYTKAFDGKTLDYFPLYIFGAVLFCAYMLLAIILPLGGLEIPYLSFRNGWLTGLPMFLMGLFLRQYGDHLIRVFRLNRWKLAAIAAFGIGFSLAQNVLTVYGGISLGLPIGVFGLVWFMIQTPQLPGSHVLSHFGGISTGTYLFHLTVGIIFDTVAPEFDPMLRPLVILLLSFGVGIVWDLVTCRKRKK